MSVLTSNLHQDYSCLFDITFEPLSNYFDIPYVEVSFDTCVSKLNFHIRFLEVHIILNQSQDAMWHFLTKFN
jgi:hypothetical protein